jgi:hypothetical protein
VSSESNIQFEFRGEGITYSLPDKYMHLWFTWIDGARIYTKTINKWEGGLLLTRDEKKKVFNEVLRFVEQKAEKPIIVIDKDDPSRGLWEELCSASQPLIKSIEYTSREVQYQSQRKMYLDFIKAGKKVVIDGVEISNVKDLNAIMKRHR